MKPFLLIATRPEPEVADTEYEAFCRYSGLHEGELVRIRLEEQPLPAIDPNAISGIMLAGSPFTTTDPQESKSETQVRVELDMGRLLDLVMAENIPLLGACYGVSTLGIHQGGVVDRTYAENAGPIDIRLTDAGRRDPLIAAASMPDTFQAFVGHKEATTKLPPNATLLATGDACPVQMFRIGDRQYASQFHPELDVPGLVGRLRAYRDEGYFPSAELDALVGRVQTADVSAAPGILRGFVKLFAREG